MSDSTISRRGFLAGAAGLTLGGSALLAACGGDSKSSGTTSTANADAAKGANLSVFLATHASFYAMTARGFERDQGATVKFTREAFATIPTKLTPAFQSGGATWDVVYLWRGWVEQYGQFLTPLSELGYDAAPLQDRILPVAWEAIQDHKGTIYGLPSNTYTYVLYGNKALLDKAGISKLPTTYSDFKAAAQELTAGGQFGYTDGWAPGYLMPKWLVWFHLNGGKLYADGDTGAVQFNTPEAMQATQDMIDLLPSMPKQAVTSPWGIYDVEAKKLFLSGRAAMTIDYSHLWYEARSPQLSKLKADDVMVGLVPGNLNGGPESATQYTAECFAIPKTSENKEAALELVKYLTSPENQLGLLTQRDELHRFDPASEDGLPAYKEDYTSAKVPAADKPLVDTTAKQQTFPGNRYGTRPAYQQISDTIEAAVSSALTKQADVEKAHKTGQAKLDQIVKQERL